MPGLLPTMKTEVGFENWYWLGLGTCCPGRCGAKPIIRRAALPLSNVCGDRLGWKTRTRSKLSET